MPTMLMSRGVLELYCYDEKFFRSPEWLSITGLRDGFFPELDTDLPTGWTRRDADAVKSFFTAFKAKSESERDNFSKNARMPGCAFWNKWINSSWSKDWDMNSRISAEWNRLSIHPSSIMRATGTTKWPSYEYYGQPLVDAVGRLLWGEKCLLLPMRVTHPDLCRFISACALRVWNTARVATNRMAQRMAKKKLLAQAAIKACDGSGNAKRSLIKAIKAVKVYKGFADLVGSTADIGDALAMQKTIAAIFERDDEQIANYDSTGTTRLTRQGLLSLASAQDIAELEAFYDVVFSTREDDICDVPALQTLQFADVSVGDLGVEAESQLTAEQLNVLLGYVNSRPPMFNKWRTTVGTNPWSHPQSFPSSEAAGDIPPGFENKIEPLHLHWHQLVAVLAIVRRFWSAEPGDCTGVLVADEVGLGKTAVSIAVMEMMINVFQAEKRGKPLPLGLPGPFIGSTKGAPNLPQLVVAPGTLAAQWHSELQVFMRPKNIEVLLYTGGYGVHHDFWGPNGPVKKSQMDLANIIIVASHSALVADYNLVYNAKEWKTPLSDGSKRQRYDLPPKHETSIEPCTIYGQQFGCIIIDEAHHMRNVGTRYYAALALRQQARTTLLLTATPLHTAPKDITSLGTILGIPYFLTEESAAAEKATISAIRNARKRITAKEKNLLVEINRKLLSGIVDDSRKDPSVKLREIYIQAILVIQSKFLGRLIRRSSNSVDRAGKPIVGIEPYVPIHALIKLSDHEQDLLDQMAHKARTKQADAHAAAGHFFVTRTFYLEYRLLLACGTTETGGALPATLAEWEEKLSTKMDICAKICRQLLSSDDAPDVVFNEDGTVQYQETADPQEGQTLTKERKIVIYQEFASAVRLLLRVLSFFSLNAAYINGSMTLENRQAAVERFRSEVGGPRILIISSVGAAGLNLSCACVMILLDQPWSAQDERQIIGRVWRQPQAKVVKVYHILAMGTTDVLMSSMARGKAEMLDAFVTRESGQQLLLAFSEDATMIDEIDAVFSDVEDASVGKKKPRAAKKRVKTTPAAAKAVDEPADMSTDHTDADMISQQPAESHAAVQKSSNAVGVSDIPAATINSQDTAGSARTGTSKMRRPARKSKKQSATTDSQPALPPPVDDTTSEVDGQSLKRPRVSSPKSPTGMQAPRPKKKKVAVPTAKAPSPQRADARGANPPPVTSSTTSAVAPAAVIATSLETIDFDLLHLSGTPAGKHSRTASDTSAADAMLCGVQSTLTNMSSEGDNCALAPDGTLLPANKITWFNDPDDETPMAIIDVRMASTARQSDSTSRRASTDVRMTSPIDVDMDFDPDRGVPPVQTPPRIPGCATDDTYTTDDSMSARPASSSENDEDDEDGAQLERESSLRSNEGRAYDDDEVPARPSRRRRMHFTSGYSSASHSEADVDDDDDTPRAPYRSQIVGHGVPSVASSRIASPSRHAPSRSSQADHAPRAPHHSRIVRHGTPSVGSSRIESSRPHGRASHAGPSTQSRGRGPVRQLKQSVCVSDEESFSPPDTVPSIGKRAGR